MERMMKKIPPNKYFCWVVHMDGMEELHDVSVARKGVFKRAIAGIDIALNQGYRVCTNTTIFRGSNVEDLQTLFGTMSEMGVEGCMVSPGYDYKAVPNRDLFLSRQESKQVFKEVLEPKKTKGIRFYNNPLFLDFLRGRREYQCTAWSNPTYTVMGWRKPCYPLADGHTQNLTELYEAELWEKKYGVGRDQRCSNCMMHCGFESATIFKALSTPKDWVKLVTSGAFKKSGVTAA
jgi:hopanoid biosynthesis associated radical SAM protein HpnH